MKPLRSLLLLCPQLSCIVVLGLAPAASAETASPGDPIPGERVDRVLCAADWTHSYAVYLPSTYRPDRPWPILYCFDPRGSGQRPVRIVQAAAERYGYIVVGSNNARNGPWKEIDVATRRLVRDTERRFRLDPRRRYSLGFSGGSRAASAAAIRFGFAGVIGCGAGLPENGKPDRIRFAYFGAVGDRDYNYSEMQDLMSTLATHTVPHRLVVFPGAHEWLPESVAEEALTWFELHAMRRGTRPKDEAMIRARLAERLLRAAAAPEQGEAYLEYEQIVADFEGLADTSGASDPARALKDTKPVRHYLSSQKRLRRQENEWLDQLYAAVEFALHPPERDVATEMFAQVPALAASMGNDPEDAPRSAASANLSASFATLDTADRFAAVRRLGIELNRKQADNAAARRVLSHGMSMLERAYWSAEAGDLVAAATYAECVTLLQPNAPEPYFLWARICAMGNDCERGRELLSQARAKGFRDAARLAELEQKLAP